MRYKSGCGGMILFFAIFLAVGVGLSAYGWPIFQNARVSENWPSTQGQIINSTLTESTDEDGTTYYADVTFDYVVDDHRHIGDEVSFGQYGSSDRSHAQATVDRYINKARVVVYYDPARPETAVLEPGFTWGSFFILGMGLFFFSTPFIVMPLFIFFRHGKVR